MPAKQFFGKYRGTVLNNVDPMQMGRLQAIVPDIANIIPSSWAMPCVPVAGIQAGILAVPVIGSGVWIEYEQGDPDYPIWSGCFWGSAAEVPALALAAPPALQQIVLQTIGQNTVLISDVPGPTGGDTAENDRGRDDFDFRHRHHHYQRAGRHNHADRTLGHRE